jgi:hypothetical protein
MKAAIATSSAEPPVAEVMQRLLDKYARMRGRAASVHAGTRRAQPRSEPATKSHVSCDLLSARHFPTSGYSRASSVRTEMNGSAPEWVPNQRCVAPH